jgi:hypothetical protein
MTEKGRVTDGGALSPSEDAMQAAIWRRLWNDYPFLRRLIWHVPNQGSSTKEGVRLQAMGVLAGVWDLHMLWKGVFHIWELKTGSNQLTRDRVDRKGKKHFGQLEWGELMATHGAMRHVCRTEQQFFEELDAVLESTGKQL